MRFWFWSCVRKNELRVDLPDSSLINSFWSSEFFIRRYLRLLTRSALRSIHSSSASISSSSYFSHYLIPANGLMSREFNSSKSVFRDALLVFSNKSYSSGSCCLSGRFSGLPK